MNAPASTRLDGARLAVARAAWASLVLTGLVLFALGIAEKYRQPLREDCQVIECNPIDLTADDLAAVPTLNLHPSIAGPIWATVGLLWNLGYVAAGLLIFLRRSDDWMALLVAFALIDFGAVGFSPASSLLPITRPEFAPLSQLLEALAYSSLFLLLLLFPDGRFVPRWCRWALLPMVLFALTASEFMDQALSGFPWWEDVAIGTFLAFVPVAAFSQIYRYRRVSTPAQRQQTKWVSLGLASQIAVMSFWILMSTAFPAEHPSPTRTIMVLIIAPLVIFVVAFAFPASVTLAILRRRLWDIDLVIRRTLAYSTLTAILALVYFGGVVLLQSLFTGLGGQRSGAAVVISTLAGAALFTPLRRRIQAFIDRRFYRRKYDAERTLAGYAATARDEVDLEHLAESLVVVVDEAMQPATISLWIKDTR